MKRQDLNEPTGSNQHANELHFYDRHFPLCFLSKDQATDIRLALTLEYVCTDIAHVAIERMVELRVLYCGAMEVD
jgi:hypothetical protein